MNMMMRRALANCPELDLRRPAQQRRPMLQIVPPVSPTSAVILVSPLELGFGVKSLHYTASKTCGARKVLSWRGR
ncbi:MAG: hypothetical protein ABSE73_20065, partial [Planctomycetota bacterium]